MRNDKVSDRIIEDMFPELENLLLDELNSLEFFYINEKINLMFFSMVLMFCGIVSALLVIGLKNPVHAVFSLILTFTISAILLITLVCDYLAIIFVIVYVGAIAVLFSFVVMMLNIKFIQFTESLIKYIPFSCIIFFIFISQSYFERFYLQVGTQISYNWVYYFQNSDNIILLANNLYTRYFYIFLSAGIVLLIAMIGTIVITLYHKTNVKRQIIDKQLRQTLFSSILLKKKI